MQFEVSEERPGKWSWTLRGSSGETIARSPVGYPSQVQASAAATAFARMVAKASAQMHGR
jgi:uncharacterized protein YegP (UPF0339 family)